MARIQKLESDSSFNLSKVPAGQILVYTVLDQSTGQVYHRAKLDDNSVVTIGQQQGIQNAVTYFDIMPQPSSATAGTAAVFTGTTGLYVKGHTYQCLQSGDSYTWLDITPALKSDQLSYISFNSVVTSGTEISVTFNTFKAPVGLYTNSGNYYPVEKLSVQLNQTYGTTRIILNPYLAYDNQSSFQGSWLCFFASGTEGDTQTARFDPQQYEGIISSLQSQLPKKLPWPTNSKIPGYVLTVASNGSDVVWTADAGTLLLNSYYTKYQAASNASSIVSAALSRFNNSTLTGDYYTTLQVNTILSSYVTSDSLAQHLSSKVTLPSGGLPGYVLTKGTGNSVGWTSIGTGGGGNTENTGDTFVAANYYTSGQVNTSFCTVASASAISGSLASKIDMPSSTVSSGYVLMKTSEGITWTSMGAGGGTGVDGFNSADYYTRDYINSHYYTSDSVNSLLNRKLDYNPAFIQFYPASTTSIGGYIDFHYKGSSADYTARIVQHNSGVITLEGDGGIQWRSSGATSGYKILDQRDLSSYYTSGTVDQKLGSKIDMPSNTVSSGYVLMKTSDGVGWSSMSVGGGTTGDTFVAANYYTSGTVDQKLASKIDMPSSTVSSGYVLMKTSEGITWTSMDTEGGIIISSGATEPQNPTNGMIWINPNQATIYGITIVSSSTAPTNPTNGTIWIN